MKFLLFKKRLPGMVAIRKIGRDEWLYQNGERKMRIYAELLAGDEGIEIDFRSMLRWLPPHEQELLDSQHRKWILQEFCNYLVQRKINWQIRR